MKKEIGVGLLGFGTVGAGVADGLQKNAGIIADRVGLDVQLRKIADLDLETDRGVKVDPAIMTTDAQAVISDPSVDIVVELIGGTGIAKELMLKAFENGKPVVTANKALLAECGEEIFSAAEKARVDLGYEASVAGGIPIIKGLKEGLVANRIHSAHGILNGTCNYILTRMENEGLPFDQVLKEAQEAGFAEAEPSLDIDGLDTAHKAVILASIAYGWTVPMDAAHVEGIRGLDARDLQYAKELGYRIKLLGVIKNVDGEVEVRVHPTLVTLEHTLAHVGGVFNAVIVQGDVVGDTLYYGKGAGRYPTASAVISDIVDIARNLSAGDSARVEHRGEAGKIRPMDKIVSKYYLRLSLLDQPGMLATVAQILGKHDISIEAVLQQGANKGEHVPVIIITHRATEKNFEDALREVDALDGVGAETVRFRIEDFEE